MGRPLIDITGQRFGILTVIEPVYIPEKKRWKWKCQCDCGNTTYSSANNLKAGVQSCGCLHRKWSHNHLYKHGKTNSRLFPIWQSMKQRCENPNCQAYANYGGRGIKVCDEWNEDFQQFESWSIANGYDENAPKGQCTIERIDVNGNYEPSNCRWATMAEQGCNRRSCVFVEYNGERKTLAEWSRITGLTHATIRGRLLRGWDVESAFTTPPKRKKRK